MVSVQSKPGEVSRTRKDRGVLPAGAGIEDTPERPPGRPSFMAFRREEFR
jgi:hypothetical protein